MLENALSILAVVCRANYIISQKNGYDHEFDK